MSGTNPQPGTTAYTRRLRLAKIINRITRPLDGITIWAARVIVEDRLRQQGMYEEPSRVFPSGRADG